MPNAPRWRAGGRYIHVPLLKTNFSISVAAKYSQNFQTFARMEVAVYERNFIQALQVLCKLQVS